MNRDEDGEDLFQIGDPDLEQMDLDTLLELQARVISKVKSLTKKLQHEKQGLEHLPTADDLFDESDIAYWEDRYKHRSSEIAVIERQLDIIWKLNSAVDRFVRQAKAEQGFGAADLGSFEREPDPNAFLNPFIILGAVHLGKAFIDAVSFKAPGKVHKAVTDSEKHVKIVHKLVRDVSKLQSDLIPIMGLAKEQLRTSKTKLTLERYALNVPDAQPSAHYESLMTVPAMTYLTLLDDTDRHAPVQPRDLDSVLNFCQRLETKGERKLRKEKIGSLCCETQAGDGVSAAVQGNVNNVQKVHLWEDGSELMWYMVDDTFRSQNDFSLVERAMFASTGAWNKVAPGGIKFKAAGSVEEAHFLVVFQESGKMSPVSSFFPEDYVRGYSTVRVFSAGVEESAIVLSNALCHALGHVLGFRHNYVILMEQNRSAGEAITSDSLSAMSFAFPSKINLADVITSRAVYERFSGYGQFELEDGYGTQMKFEVQRITA